MRPAPDRRFAPSGEHAARCTRFRTTRLLFPGRRGAVSRDRLISRTRAGCVRRMRSAPDRRSAPSGEHVPRCARFRNTWLLFPGRCGAVSRDRSISRTQTGRCSKDEAGPGSALRTVRGACASVRVVPNHAAAVSRPLRSGEPGSVDLATTGGGGVRRMRPAPDRRSAPSGGHEPRSVGGLRGSQRSHLRLKAFEGLGVVATRVRIC